MGKLRPFPIVGGSYTDDALPWAHQDTVNYLPVRAEREGTRSPAKLAMVPGMRVFADVGTGPHRGARDVEGQRFVVSGTTLYQIALDGVATAIGTIPGTGRVCMTHNQITGGNQVVIGAGSSGYVYNTYTGVFGQITDDAFPGLKSVDFLNQYILGVEPFGRYWFHSALVDAESYNALDEYQAETSPDRIVGLIALHNEVLVFGPRSIEPWANIPTQNASFQLQRGSVIESGCASGDTIVKLDNSVFYLTDNGQIARLNGYTPQIVSTYALEGAIRGCELSRAFAFAWEDKGHTVYYITFPDGCTWGYDVRQNEWHRRKSYGLDRWRLNTLFKSAGHWYGGDYQTGKLYRLDWDYALDGCDPIERIRTCGYIHASGERVTVNAFQVRMDTGAVESVPHDGVTVSGSMPDAYVGETVDFTYTVALAYPGQSYTLSVSGLPTGLTMDAAGHVTGTATAAGAFTVTITTVDDCGNVTTHADPVTVSTFIISGDVPDGATGDAASGAYTATHGIEPITYAVTSGTFPAGLTLNADGTYTGSYTTGGSYAWVVTGTDANGNTATIADTAAVAEGQWWMTRQTSSVADTNLYVSTDDGASFGTTAARSPTITDFAYGPQFIATGVALIANANGGNTDAERITDFAYGDGVTTTLVTVPPNIRFIREFDGTQVMTRTNSAIPYFSTDDGVTWVAGPSVPQTGGGSVCKDVARLSNGRWITAGFGVSPQYFYYSDEPIPTVWSRGARCDDAPGDFGSAFLCDGTTALTFNRVSDDVRKTTDGVTWTTVTLPSHGVDASLPGAADNGIFIACMGGNGSTTRIKRSTDNGLTWATVTVSASYASGASRVEYGNGVWIASCNGTTPGPRLYRSTDNGLSWASIPLPISPAFNDELIAAFVRHVP